MISRLAPTPSGYLHWGNLYNFALTWAMVRQAGGRLALRIDDVDASRMRTEYVENIFSMLDWLGIDYDEGPRSSREFFDRYSQAIRKSEYFERARALTTYACRCSRKQIEARVGKSGVYDGFCQDKKHHFIAGETALRVDLDAAPGVIVWTRDDRPSYHLVSVIEDLRLGTTHLMRGQDLRDSSLIQQKLARALGETRYSEIEHRFHPLLLDSQGKKLSKSANSDSLEQFRARGETAERVWCELSRRAGLAPVAANLRAFVSQTELAFPVVVSEP